MKLIIKIVALALVMASFASAQIAGSKHDMSSTQGNTISSTNNDELCVFCHTPHAPAVKNSLWNRNEPAGPFIVFADGQGGAFATHADSLSTGSLQCLSCHDGTSAVNTVANVPYAGAITMGVSTLAASPNGNMGLDLTNDHPVGVVLSVGGDYTAPGGTDVKLFGPGGNLVQCNSCHDPHNGTVVAEQPFLVKSNAQSAICTECHAK
jgi:predicted CXXCH cytochrome family protein